MVCVDIGLLNVDQKKNLGESQGYHEYSDQQDKRWWLGTSLACQQGAITLPIPAWKWCPEHFLHLPTGGVEPCSIPRQDAKGLAPPTMCTQGRGMSAGAGGVRAKQAFKTGLTKTKQNWLTEWHLCSGYRAG
jgi:hypothetical protein